MILSIETTIRAESIRRLLDDRGESCQSHTVVFIPYLPHRMTS